MFANNKKRTLLGYFMRVKEDYFIYKAKKVKKVKKY